MPLFNFECPNCHITVEHFFHSAENVEVVCESCGTKCDRVFSMFGNRSDVDAKTALHEKILPEARKISEQIGQGNDEAFLDLCGEK